MSSDSPSLGYPFVSVAEVIDIQGGAQPPASTFKSSPTPGYVRFVQIRDFESDAHLTFIRQESRWRYCTAQDVLIARYGASVGRICRGVSGAYNVALAKVMPKDADLDFLYYLLQSSYFQGPIAAMSGRSAQAGFNKSDLAAIQVPIPPRQVQRSIASVLKPLDDRIALLRETNATLEAIAQALFKSWFVDFDPVRAKSQGLAPAGMDEATAALFPDGFEESALGQVPAGWRWDRLESIADVVMGLSPTGDSYNSDGAGVPLVNGPVEYGEYFPVRTKWTTSITRVANQHDLILCVRGSTTGRRVISDGDYCIGRGVCAIRCKLGLHTFIYKTIDFGLPRLLTKTTGSVFPSLSAPDIKQFLVLCPPLPVRLAFEECAAPLTARIQANHRHVQVLTEVRDTLLPRLISGQLRLPEAEQAVAAAS